MSVILAVLAAAILVAYGIIRGRKRIQATEEVIVRRYIHPGHAWLRITPDGDVLVGIDDFAQSLIGTIEDVRLPRHFRRLEQGAPAMQVVHGKRTVTFVSPVTGRVVGKNEMVLQNPTLVNTAPYGDGWVLRIRPRRIVLQLHNLLTGKSAQRWQDTVRAQLAGLFAATPALMYQDGGELLKDLADRCSDDEWTKVTRMFFMTDESTVLP